MPGRIPMLLVLILSLIGFAPFTAGASSQGTDNMMKAEQYIDQALAEAKQGHLQQSKDAFQKFNDMWLDIEDTIKTESGQVYSESNMGQIQYAFIQNSQKDVIQALQGLQDVNKKFIDGQYAKGDQFKKENITLSDFITLLQQTKEKAKNQDPKAAQEEIAKVRQSWLSVEGVVITQSATIYNDTERDMGTINGMLAANQPDYQGAVNKLDQMIQYLTPLASKAG
jgi:high-affinity iron transporter